MVPKTDGEIYVSMSIDKYIITATCFLHCAKEGRIVGNIESEVFIWKIIIEKISMLKWYKKKDNFFSQSLSHPVVFYKTEPEIFEAALAVVLGNDVVSSIMQYMMLLALKYCLYYTGHLLVFYKTVKK